jgi:putative restriction endonuclease
MKQSVGDWVVLRRPRADGGNLAYFAIARVLSISPDSKVDGMSYARLDQYLPFDDPVPWQVNKRYAEEALRELPVTQVGLYLRGRSVRSLSDEDFLDLVKHGFSKTFELHFPLESSLTPLQERVRQVESRLINRVMREASFRRAICDAYDSRCAITGLRLFDRRGNAEAQAAHIWAVSEGGPDLVQNGIALSATFHWLFDRHLISISDDHELLVADNLIPAELKALFAPHGGKVLLPSISAMWPHPIYLAKHRALFQSKSGSAAP